MLAGQAYATDWSAWQRSYDPATRTRFIPVELWTGAPWDGTQEIHMAPAALEFGQPGDKSIKGPTTWNGIQVYERLNRDKLQRFAKACRTCPSVPLRGKPVLFAPDSTRHPLRVVCLTSQFGQGADVQHVPRSRP